jgi:hypothetical protein
MRARAGITRDTDVDGIVRDDSGEPTGEFAEMAAIVSGISYHRRSLRQRLERARLGSTNTKAASFGSDVSIRATMLAVVSRAEISPRGKRARTRQG